MAIKRSFILSTGIGVSVDNLFVVNNTNSVSSTTGSIVLSGGIGIGQSVSLSGRLQMFNGANYTSFVSSASGNTVYTLPATSPATGSSVLQSTSAGVLSWVPLAASGGTAQNVAVNSAGNANVFHQILFTPSSSSSGSAVSSDVTISFNPSTEILNVSGLAITSTTASTSTSNGALQVAGGVGISGRLSFNQASFGTTGIATNPSMAMIGQTGDPIFMTVLEDNSIAFEGAQGQLFSITPNLSTGYIYSVNDITGIPLIRANANANVTANEYAGNFGIGLTNPGYKLHVLGSVGFTSTTASTSTTTGALIVSGGVGIGGSIFGGSTISAADNIEIRSGKELRLNNSGNTFYTGIKSGANVSNTTYTLPTALPGAGTSVLQSDTSGTLSWTGIVGFATTSTNINVVAASTSASHPVLFTPTLGTVSGAAVSTESTFVYNPSTDILSVSGLAITSGTASTSPTTGALRVTGGVGIGGNLNVGTAITGVSNMVAGFAGNQPTLAIQNTLNDFEGVSTLKFLDSTQKSAYIEFWDTASYLPNFFIINNSVGNITISAGVGKTIFFGVNGLKASVNEAAFTILHTTASGSTSTGALVVTGGVGIGGSVSVGGRLQMFNGANYTAFVSSASGNTVYTLPATSPATGSSVLQSTSAGVMSWVPMTASSGGSGTTSANVNIVAAGNANVFHPVLFTPSSLSAGSAVSSDSTITFNPSTEILNVSGIAITSGTASTNTTTGALVVRGGLGVTGQLSFAQASFGFTGITTNPTMSFIGATTSSPITLTVLTDNSLNFEGSQGSVFSIDSNLSSGEIFSVSDISGLPIISASAGQTVNINEFGGFTQIGNGSINSSSTTTGSLVVAGGMGVTGNANIGGTVRITNTTASTTSSSGALTVSGGAGIAQTLFVGGSISNANYFYSGGNNFTKSGQAQGDILLDNNQNDTPGVLYYYKNNTNFGIDAYAVGIGATRLRIVKDLNESGGAELWSIDRTGVVTQTAWAAGETIKTQTYNYSDLGMSSGGDPTSVNSTSYTTIATGSYTPSSSSSYLWIEFSATYDYNAGSNADEFAANIEVGGTEIVNVFQKFITATGGGTRSGVLFPLSGRYTNSGTSTLSITVRVKRNSGDDPIRVFGNAGSGLMRIQEIGR